MYTDFYKLAGFPFQLTPDHRFYFDGRTHRQALANITSGLRKGEGLIVVTGEVGAGKTTLIDHLLSQLRDKRLIIAKIVTSQVEADNLLRLVAGAFGLAYQGVDKVTLLGNIEGFLIASRKAGGQPLLIIDEVQSLTQSSLEQLQVLSDFQHGATPVLQVLLVGQPQFRETLMSDGLAQFRQRVIASYHLQPLGAEETRRYIEHRLQHVGWQNDPSLPDQSFPLIYTATGGVPRQINLLCDRLLLQGFLQERHEIATGDIDEVVVELQEEGSLPQVVAHDRLGPASDPGPAASEAAAASTDLRMLLQRVIGLKKELETQQEKLQQVLTQSGGETNDPEVSPTTGAKPTVIKFADYITDTGKEIGLDRTPDPAIGAQHGILPEADGEGSDGGRKTEADSVVAQGLSRAADRGAENMVPRSARGGEPDPISAKGATTPSRVGGLVSRSALIGLAAALGVGVSALLLFVGGEGLDGIMSDKATRLPIAKSDAAMTPPRGGAGNELHVSDLQPLKAPAASLPGDASPAPTGNIPPRRLYRPPTDQSADSTPLVRRNVDAFLSTRRPAADASMPDQTEDKVSKGSISSKGRVAFSSEGGEAPSPEERPSEIVKLTKDIPTFVQATGPRRSGIVETKVLEVQPVASSERAAAVPVDEAARQVPDDQTTAGRGESIAPKEGVIAPKEIPAPKPDRLVFSVQRRLKMLGFDPGPIDGHLGPQTSAAITSYQGEYGLALDGQATTGLLNRLEREIFARTNMKEPSERLVEKESRPAVTGSELRQDRPGMLADHGKASTETTANPKTASAPALTDGMVSQPTQLAETTPIAGGAPPAERGGERVAAEDRPSTGSASNFSKNGGPTVLTESLMARAPGTAAASSANDSGTQVSSRREDRPSVIQRGAGAKDSLLDRVVELYSVAIEESDLPDSRLAAAYSKRGIAYGNQGRYALAIEDLSQSLQMQPNSAEVYFQRGRMYEAKGDEQRAAGDFEKAHLLDPENPDYRAKMEELARSGAVKPVDSGGCTSSSTRLC